jgi:hypothetical protein
MIMTARTTFEAAVLATGNVQIAAVAAAELTRQETVNVVGVNAGANPMLGATNSQIATINAANAAKAAAVLAAEVAKQASLAAARNTLRSSGDTGPV